jgi:hypothetical protein
MASRAWGQTLDDDPARLVRRTTRRRLQPMATGHWRTARRLPAAGRCIGFMVYQGPMASTTSGSEGGQSSSGPLVARPSGRFSTEAEPRWLLPAPRAKLRP